MTIKEQVELRVKKIALAKEGISVLFSEGFDEEAEAIMDLLGLK